jgi:hypothetical protein
VLARHNQVREIRMQKGITSYKLPEINALQNRSFMTVATKSRGWTLQVSENGSAKPRTKLIDFTRLKSCSSADQEGVLFWTNGSVAPNYAYPEQTPTILYIHADLYRSDISWAMNRRIVVFCSYRRSIVMEGNHNLSRYCLALGSSHDSTY